MRKDFACFSLSLALLVLGVLADNANDTAAMDHLALVTDLLY
jgi:hypothetical protein